MAVHASPPIPEWRYFSDIDYDLVVFWVSMELPKGVNLGGGASVKPGVGGVRGIYNTTILCSYNFLVEGYQC